jgi:hypothetical protein
VTLAALEGGAALDELYRRLAVGAGEDLKKFGVYGHTVASTERQKL